jgi:hypothetical protein
MSNRRQMRNMKATHTATILHLRQRWNRWAYRNDRWHYSANIKPRRQS